ncbi:CheR-type MCP methyltransferase [Novosphingobium sp. PhB165]|uniref:CheR family methyltransferase n=1 Tax=Novosphingobium sp. PhB165 TaxID=2485105 RepID=UPI0010525022|nr:protein-glutamate O-methyltransferase CheR [Novosphingobium sp. PhB165]TCM20635.1 CheR-type MCP methyltransferase [Novosphingobium sp. PhB165]
MPPTDEDIAQVSTLLYMWTGMVFSEKKAYYIERRLIERIRRTGSGDMRTYFGRLMGDEAERQALINAVTINESYFYREDNQFAALANAILPELAATKAPGGRIRIWSMPCAHGEEAYSIAIWLLENWAMVDAYHVEIVGSDIDTHALASARDGHYGKRALARLPEAAREAYFEPEKHYQRRIIKDLRESVQFTHVNLVDAAAVASQGRFDVILCRNLLIYFDEISRASAAGHLYNALLPRGFLCLGHSESMARIDTRFNLVRLDDAIVYRRP